MRGRSTRGSGRVYSGNAMKKCRVLLFVVLAAGASAQTASQIESDEVKRVGAHLKCSCGCNDNLNCNMSSGQCPICKPARTRIFRMQQGGMKDDAIIASFVKSTEFMLLSDPSSYFWTVPCFSLALGGGALWIALRRLRSGKLTPVAAGPTADNDPEFTRYFEAIEKDADTLDE